MASRELVVLGTASQVPTRYRNHNGYFLRWDGEGLLFDPGEGTQRQMSFAGVSATDITRILITHFHGDHCLGLAGVIQRISLDAVPHRIPVHYPASGQEFYERLRHASIYRDRARIDARPIEVEGVLVTGPLQISTLRLEHPVESWGYRLVEPDRRSLVPSRLEALGIDGPAVGRLQREGRLELGARVVTVEEMSVRRPGQIVAFVMDTGWCPNAIELARGADLLVCESTFTSDDRAKAIEYGHLTAAQAATIAVEAGVRRLVLTHFSQRYQNVRPLLEEAAAIHPDVVAARDGMIVPVPDRPPRPESD